jgi:predicted transcriptional regulator
LAYRKRSFYKQQVTLKNKGIMSKTVELQIEKSRHLIEGLRKHLSGMGGGITSDEINSMEQSLKELESANAEVDRLREELTPKVKQMNEVLARVKEAYADKKKTLKGYYPQERWADYGIPDKR